jgi:hypothetical protein
MQISLDLYILEGKVLVTCTLSNTKISYKN